jgi:hypothetical protein
MVSENNLMAWVLFIFRMGVLIIFALRSDYCVIFYYVMVLLLLLLLQEKLLINPSSVIKDVFRLESCFVLQNKSTIKQSMTSTFYLATNICFDRVRSASGYQHNIL